MAKRTGEPAHGRIMTSSQQYITPNTPMGANLTGDGATFRVWAPRAEAVYVCYDDHWEPEEPNRLVRDPRGYWAGYIPGIHDGTHYKFYVVGTGSRSYKRDPYARELAGALPHPKCVVRD